MGSYAAGIVACLCLCCLLATPAWSQTNSPSPLRDPALEELLQQWQSRLVTLEQMQMQHEATVRAIESLRQDLASALALSASNTTARMSAMTDALTAQQERDLASIRASNRLTLTVMLALAGLLFLGLLLLARVSALAMDRLAAVVTGLPRLHPAWQLHAAPGEGGDTTRLLRAMPLGGAQLHNAIERLESRIAGLETLAAQGQPREEHKPDNHSSSPASETHPPRTTSSPPVVLAAGPGPNPKRQKKS